VSYFRPQKAEKPARGASAASRIQLRNCLEKGVGSVLGTVQTKTGSPQGFTQSSARRPVSDRGESVVDII
jgi:hypothetical protein